MTAKQMWNLFKKKSQIDTDKYEDWSFGDSPDELAQLVLEGKKCAAASVYELYDYDGEDLPKVGDYSVIMDSKEHAVCVIVNTDVKIVPFSEVDEEHARLEGEGDGSLDYWKSVHSKLFAEWLSEAGKSFSDKTKVVLERFKMVFSGREQDAQPR